ncbi:MAG: thermonuclease family protein [Candidatus Electrothrix sp. LOE2]|nr:thermonuclease family protein [Candidatus Electrothrix sp. LOE2]
MKGKRKLQGVGNPRTGSLKSLTSLFRRAFLWVEDVMSTSGTNEKLFCKKYLWVNMVRYKILSCVCVFLWLFFVQDAHSIGVNPKSKTFLRKTLKDYSASKSNADAALSNKSSSKSSSSSSSGKKKTSRAGGLGSAVGQGAENKIVYTLPESKAFQPATMVDIEDGDTIHVMLNDSPFTVSLYGIDSPERTQPHGMQAVRTLTKLLDSRKISLQIYDKKAEERRCLAVVSVGEKNVNELLVKGGHAWVRSDYCYESFCSDWLSSQAQAKAAKKGLWSYPEPIAPWAWRAMPPERRQTLQYGYSPVDNGLRSRYGKDTTIIGR